MFRLLATIRPFFMPVGLMLVQKAVSYEQEAAEARRAELADLEAAIEERRAELAQLAPEHRPDCLTTYGYDCDTPNACAEFAARWEDDRAERLQQVNEMTAAEADEEPAPGPAREEFPPDPLDPDHRELSSVTGFAIGALLVLGATAYRLHRNRKRRRQLGNLAAYLPTFEQRQAARARLRDEPPPGPWEHAEPADLFAMAREETADDEGQAATPEPPADVERDEAYACGWGCGWAPRNTHSETKQLRRSLHENQCDRRPASMAVKGA